MDIDCKDGNFKCPLGTMGCAFPQISGQPASHVKETHDTEQKCFKQASPLSPNQYDLMIVGDMPSVEDDRIDMIWSDNTGVRIIDFLEKAGHDLNRVWMTKITKCRPRVKGRKPSVSEINTCRDNYLRKEIELIQPKVVMLVGAQALRAFNLLGHGSPNTIHGRVFEARFARQPDMKDQEYDTQPIYKVIPTVNPAIFYYRPNKQLEVRIGYDYVIAKDILEGREPSKHFVPDYHVIDTPDKLNWLKGKLLNSTLFGWDTESPTTKYRKEPVILFQFAWGWEKDQCAVLPIMQHDPNAPKEQEFHLKSGFGAKNEELVTEFMREVFLTPNIAKAAHNQKYDANVLLWNYGVKIEGFLYDTWIMKHLQE